MFRPACVILAGGLGRRLRPAVKGIPKPLAPVRGRPFLSYLIRQAAGAGIEDIVLCVGYGKDAVEKAFGDGSAFGVRIRYSRETRLLGTGGALRKAFAAVTTDPFIVMNGDSFCGIDLKRFIASHRACGALVTIAGVSMPDCSRYGSLEVGKRRMVTGFREKEHSRSPGLINGGVYAVSKKALRFFPRGRCSLEKEVFPRLASGGKLRAFPSRGFFIDIGIPADYRKAQGLFR